MALIRQFDRKELERVSVHDEVEATYAIVERDGRKLLQIDSYGRATRAIPGKVSQSIQLDEAGVKALFDIIKTEFKY